MHSVRTKSYIWIILMGLMLGACGGGSIGGGDETDPEDPAGPVIDRLILLASTPQLPSSASEAENGIEISAQAVDASGVLVADADISFSIPAGSGVLISEDNGEDGSSRVLLTTGGDPSNRTITVSAKAGDVSAALDIDVIGTSIVLSGPSAVGFNQSATYVLELTDSDGNGIANADVSFSTSAGSLKSEVATTDSSGSASTVLTATTSGEVTAETLGLTASLTVDVSADVFVVKTPKEGAEIPLDTATTVTVEWTRNGSGADLQGTTVNFSSTRGAVTPTSVVLDDNGRGSVQISSSSAGGAVIQAAGGSTGLIAQQTVEFVATSATKISAQANPDVIAINEQSEISAVTRDDVGNLVKGQTVNFNLSDVTGGTLSSPSAVTNSQGTATVLYQASNVTSSNEGVSVTASLQKSASVSSTVKLSVGGKSLFVTLGTGNDVIVTNSTTFEYPYSVSVVDSSGNPVPDATFNLSVLPVSYRKGQYSLVDEDGDGLGDFWAIQVARSCENEDVDLDGILDPGEDFNSNGALDPGNIATAPKTLELDDQGFAEFTVRYPQDHGGWVEVELRAVAAVTGSETTETARFLLPALADDLNNPDVPPPGVESPYGTTLNCSNPD